MNRRYRAVNETQKRIRAYKAALPGLRERVIAVALLLLLSAAMMTSATYAWITLSRAPEVSNVSTTVTANGNLEIALVKEDGSEPAESAVGDSSAALGQSVVNANLTWGNLVNLSDSSYGLNNIVLRPALLGNVGNLLSQPLKGVDYGEDGRLQQYYNEDYKFTNWTTKADGTGYFEFSETSKYGVRAISTVEYTYVNNTYYQFTQLMNQAVGIRQSVENAYSGEGGITENEEYINALAAMIGTYMTDNLNDSNTDVSAYIKPLYKMMRDIYELMVGSEDLEYCFEDAMAALANTQVYMKYRDDYILHTYTGETLLQASASELQANGVDLDCLAEYKDLKSAIYQVLYGSDSTKDDCIYDYYVKAYPYINEQTGEPDEDRRDTSVAIYMDDLIPYVNKMVKINTCELLLTNGESYKIGSIGKSVAMDLIMGNKLDKCNARINDGLLVDFEKITGCNMCAEKVTVSATYIMTVKITAETITTAAPAVSIYEEDVENIRNEAASDKGDYTAVAQDTYGMALDFWVRTNAPSSYLVLEGNVLTETTTVRDTGVDSAGNTVDLYTATISTKITDEEGNEETVSESVAVYKVEDADGNVTWYQANNHSLLCNYDENGNLLEGQTIPTPIERYKEVSNVIGYEGENRIWQDNALMDTSSTTQGNGSCYVFYAEDPTQQTNSLRLLSNLRVAFIDSNEDSRTYGKLVAIGKLDVDNRYEENGKVTVPLVLFNDGSSYLTKTESGLAIMALDRGKATRLTAVIYLDGREITNSDVLAASDIQGQLNIQFGSTAVMQAISNEELELATRSVTAVVKKTTDASYPDSNNGPKLDETGAITSAPDVKFSFDDASETNPMTVNVRVKVNGEAPAEVEAFFMRKVSTTQGSREGTFTLVKTSEEGVYEGQYTFTAPGEYVLRTVQLDGVDYDLPADDYPRVSIEGFGITSVNLFYGGNQVTDQVTTIMTDKRNISTELTLQFASSAKLPSNVKLLFVREDGTEVTANMTAGTNEWKGTATFSSSGLYTLKYIVLDGEYTELDTKYQKQLDISMGMTVKVIDGGDYRNTTYKGEPFTVPMYVEIYDDNGNEIKYLQGVKLYYSASGSNIEGSDPDVTWNTAQDCYVGNVLIPGPGVYTFHSVLVAGNPLTTTVNIPPTFTCMSPNPPTYLDNGPMVGMDYLLSTGTNSYSVGVRLEDAQGATVYAQIRNNDSLTDKIEEIEGKRMVDDQTGITTFTFELPKQTGTNYQSGDWTITGLKLYNVYDKDGYFHAQGDGEDNPLIMDLTQCMDDLNVKIVNVKLQIDGENEDLTGSFLETKTTTKPIEIQITDQNGDTLKLDVSDITLNYVLEANSYATYGGYTADHLTDQSGDGENDTYTLTSNDHEHYTLDHVTLVYAGKYVPNAMSFTVGGQSYSYSRNDLSQIGMPEYTLTTTKPTAKITAHTPTGTYATKITWTTSWTTPKFTAGTDQTSSHSDYSATLYAKAAADNSGLSKHGTFTQPTLTITVAGMGYADKATLTLPAGSASEIVYEYSADGSVEKTLGSIATIKTWAWGLHYLQGYTGHGSVNIETMTLTKDGITYTVTLDNPLVITNPSSVNKTS